MSEMSQGNQAPSGAVQEVQGWFPDDATLQEALSQLERAGHDRAEFSLPEEQVLVDPNSTTPNVESQAAEGSVDRQQIRTLNTGMAGYAGATIAAGAAVASGVGIPVAIGLAAAAGAATVATSTGIGAAAAQAQVDERNRRGAAGTLVLAVQVADQAQADQATQIMQQAGATRTKLVAGTDEALTAGVSASSWTG